MYSWFIRRACYLKRREVKLRSPWLSLLTEHFLARLTIIVCIDNYMIRLILFRSLVNFIHQLQSLILENASILISEEFSCMSHGQNVTGCNRSRLGRIISNKEIIICILLLLVKRYLPPRWQLNLFRRHYITFFTRLLPMLLENLLKCLCFMI